MGGEYSFDTQRGSEVEGEVLKLLYPSGNKLTASRLG